MQTGRQAGRQAGTRTHVRGLAGAHAGRLADKPTGTHAGRQRVGRGRVTGIVLCSSFCCSDRIM